MQGYVNSSIGNYVVLDPEQTYIPKQKEESYFEGFWRIYFGGACSSLGSGVGIVFEGPDYVIHQHTIRLEFHCMNNDAEYEAFIQGMILALEMTIENLIITGDFELVINHITKKYKIKKERLKFYEKRVNEVMDSFCSFNVSFIPRERNKK